MSTPLGEGGGVKGVKIVFDLFKPILLFPNFEKWVLTTKWVNNWKMYQGFLVIFIFSKFCALICKSVRRTGTPSCIYKYIYHQNDKINCCYKL